MQTKFQIRLQFTITIELKMQKIQEHIHPKKPRTYRREHKQKQTFLTVKVKSAKMYSQPEFLNQMFDDKMF